MSAFTLEAYAPAPETTDPRIPPRNRVVTRDLLDRCDTPGAAPQAACDAPRWRFNKGMNINVEAAMNAATVQGLQDLGHEIDVINDSYQDFGAGQFILRAGNPAVEGYVAASDPRRDGLAAGY